MKRPRSLLIALLTVAATVLLGCVPDPPLPTPVPSTLIVTPAAVALHPGESEQLTVEVLDQDGEPIAAPVSWSSDSPQVAEVSATGLVTAVAAGETTITATVGALSGTSAITVTAIPNTAAPEITITSPTGDVSVNEIDVVELSATASDAEDGDLSADIAWTLRSAEPAAEPVELGTGATATAGPLAPGSYTITASVTDSGGLTASAQLQVSVAQCVTTAVLTPGSGNKNKGPLTLSAAQSSDSCDRPLAYLWDCVNTKDPQKCTDLIQSGNDGKMVEYTFDIEVNEVLRVQIRACPKPIKIATCAVQETAYTGVEPIMGL